MSKEARGAGSIGNGVKGNCNLPTMYDGTQTQVLCTSVFVFLPISLAIHPQHFFKKSIFDPEPQPKHSHVGRAEERKVMSSPGYLVGLQILER